MLRIAASPAGRRRIVGATPYAADRLASRHSPVTRAGIHPHQARALAFERRRRLPPPLLPPSIPSSLPSAMFRSPDIALRQALSAPSISQPDRAETAPLDSGTPIPTLGASVACIPATQDSTGGLHVARAPPSAAPASRRQALGFHPAACAPNPESRVPH